MKIVIGSRESKLAVVQSEVVLGFLNEEYPEYEIELLTLKTRGDKILNKTLEKIGGKGLFVKELEEALLNNNCDITVHSLKDVTMDVDKKIPLKAYSRREDPRDCLVLPEGVSEIDYNKPIGTSSKRRIRQLELLYPEAKFKFLRGNVLTRLRKLDEGEFGAIVLAVSGLKRLGLEGRISKIFEVDEVVPAAGQGILVIQSRAEYNPPFLKSFNDPHSEICALCERALARKMGGGCTMPLGAYCEIEGDELILRGFYSNESGSRRLKSFVRGSIERPEELGERLGEDFLRRLQNG